MRASALLRHCKQCVLMWRMHRLRGRPVPASLASLAALKSLTLSNNKLSGSLPDLSGALGPLADLLAWPAQIHIGLIFSERLATTELCCVRHHAACLLTQHA